MNKHPTLWLSIILFFSGFLLYPQFRSLETENLRIVYFGNLHSHLVPHVARCFENALKSHKETFRYTPSEKVTLLLYDFSDYGNAAAGAIPNNRILIAIAPFNYVFEFTPANERINWVMNHELVHILASDMASKWDNFFRSIFFGKVYPSAENPLSMIYSYLTTPRIYAPQWYHEGIAVFMETWRSGGLGRALGAYDEMVFRTKILEGSHIFDPVSLGSAGTKIDFQVSVNAYLYGTRFFSYLANLYGPEKLIQWVAREENTRAYFASQFRKIFGKSVYKAWAEWIKWEKVFQTKNLKRLRTYTITPFKKISPHSLGSVSRAFYDADKKKIYLAVNYPGQVAHIASMDIETGKLKKICDVKGAALFYVTSLSYDPSTGTLFYTTDNNAWRDLKCINVRTGKSRTLMKDERIGDLSFNDVDKSLWGVRHYNGISTLVRIPRPYNKWNQVYSWPFGQDIYDLDISPDGKHLVAALTRVNGNQQLIKMEIANLLEGNFSYEAISDFNENSPANFIFSPNGKFLYGSSYYSGVSNIYRHDLKSNDTRILTNCDTGFFRPINYTEDSLIAFRYTSRGFIPVIISNKPVDNVKAITFLGQQIVENYPIVKDWKADSPASVDIKSLTKYDGKYKAFNKIKLRAAYPIVEGYKDSMAYGYHFLLTDPINLHNLELNLSYSPESDLSNSEKLHFKLTYAFQNWKFTTTHNYANFYDLFGPTKKSMKGSSLEVEYKKTLIFDEPNRFMNYMILFSGYTGLERLPDYQNIHAFFDKLVSLNFQYNYKFTRMSLGAVDSEKGFLFQTNLNHYYVNNRIYTRLYTNFDLGLQLPINHSSIWLRGSLGVAFGDRSDPFSNFYFGGFGNNWVDHLTHKRYRKYYSFPGVELNEIGGKNYGKFILEWNLPPILFKRLGFSFFYANWANISFFSSGLITNIDHQEFRKKFMNLGAQVDFRFTLLSNRQLTFSIGYAVAAQEHFGHTNEWMVSLRIH